MNFLIKLKAFIIDVAGDERIPAQDKKILAVMIALVISPVDFIPDWIPFFGQLDDLVILSFILDYFFTVLDSRVLLSHYPWDMKSFAKVRGVARFLQFLVPGFIKKRIWTYVGDPY